MSMKNPLIPTGIEPVTFQFVPQHLNHCATAVLFYYKTIITFNVIQYLKENEEKGKSPNTDDTEGTRDARDP